MTVLQPLTANLTPHPVPVAPLADQRATSEPSTGRVLCEAVVKGGAQAGGRRYRG